MTDNADALPCCFCGERPSVACFQTMTGKTAWTCLCRNRCHETATWYERDAAVADWNAWVESDGETDGDE